MNHLFHRVAACLLAASALLSNIPSAQAADVTHLRCEYRENPLGIDATRPRLSWVVEEKAEGGNLKPERGVRQTAYQILVAGSEDLLKKDKSDLWDSGKVASDQSIQVEYAGKSLESGMYCHWKVRVWDKDGKASDWSKPAWWTMGLLKPEDWKAKWIKPDVVAEKWTYPFDNCAWIWFQSSAAADQIPPGNAYFRARLTLPDGVGIRHAIATMTADNGFTLFVNGQEALKGGNWQNPYQSGDVARLLQAGENVVTVAATNTVLGYSGLIGRLKVQLDDGRQVTLETGASWKAAEREQAGWQQAGFDDTGWPAAREIGRYGAAPWNLLFRELPQSSSPWMRKAFTLAAAPERALVYVNVKGYHELWVNGQKAGDAVLTPAVSVLKKRTFYVTYDVSPLLRQGRNTLGLWLGRGWNAKGVPGVTDEHPLARVQMDCVSGNETIQIASDETWLCSQSPYTTLGPWMWNDYGGEAYDARLENLKWCDPDMDESGWKNVEVVPAPEGRTESQAAPLNRRREKIAAVKVKALGSGKYEVDFGKNLAGWVKVKMPQLKEGAEVALLFHDGYATYNQESRFISSGKPGEFFENKFNYAGFRYLTIEGLPSSPEGLPSAPDPGDVTAYLVESDLEETGSFECSNELFNRIHRLNLWTLRCLNLGGYLVDCPHRERLGYGDGQVSVETCIMNSWMPNLYEKWLRDWVDTQNPVTGALPFSTPYHMPAGPNDFGREGPPGWGGALPAIAWRTYLYYGDRRILEEMMAPMRLFLQRMEACSTGGILKGYGDDWQRLGDWVPPERGMDTHNWPSQRANDLFNNCYLIYLWELLEKSAAALGHSEEAERCRAKIAHLRPLIHKEFYDAGKGIYVIDEQAYQVMPLMTGVVPEELRSAIMKKLEDGILVRCNGHLDTGMLGTYFMIRYLSSSDRHDLLYTMMNQTTYPGWGHMLEKGATTMWEQWNAYYSQIHSCFTSPGSWFYQGLAGIRPDEAVPGFKEIIIKPAIVGDVTWVKCHHDSAYGRIVSDWNREGDKLTMDVTIPANTTATVYVPAKDAAKVAESGKPAAKAEGVKFLRMEASAAVYAVRSGTYRFQSTFPENMKGESK